MPCAFVTERSSESLCIALRVSSLLMCYEEETRSLRAANELAMDGTEHKAQHLVLVMLSFLQRH